MNGVTRFWAQHKFLKIRDACWKGLKVQRNFLDIHGHDVVRKRTVVLSDILQDNIGGLSPPISFAEPRFGLRISLRRLSARKIWTSGVLQAQWSIVSNRP